ncbi:hypothetical protein BH11PSE13_BH11PSE13_12510 [soil metagenome]
MNLANLPAIGADLEGGSFVGITTQPDGTHVAVVLLPDKGKELTWKKAIAWARKLDAQLPTRPVATLLFANVKAQLESGWHWTSDELDASDAWYCYFGYGDQGNYHKSYAGSAVAVRLIQLTA